MAKINAENDGAESSARVRDYAIAAFFIVATFAAILFISSLALIFSSGNNSPTIWSDCRADTNSANIFIGATNEDLKNVKCSAIEKGLFVEPELILGDLSKNDEGVCKFKLAKNVSEPLSFEISYNNKTRKEVCGWQFSGNLD